MNIKNISNSELRNAIKIASLREKDKTPLALMKPSDMKFREKIHAIMLDQMVFGYMDSDLDMIAALYLFDPISNLVNKEQSKNTMLDDLFNKDIIKYTNTLNVIITGDQDSILSHINKNHTSDNDLTFIFVFIGIYCQSFDINTKNDTIIALIKNKAVMYRNIVETIYKEIKQTNNYFYTKEDYFTTIDFIEDIQNLMENNKGSR